MRVLFVSQDFPPDVGGIQTYSWEISRRLASRVEEAVVVAPRRPGSEIIDRELNSRVYRLSARPDLLPLISLGSISRIARTHRLDVSFHAQWQTAAAAVLARRLSGYPKQIAVAAHGRELLFNQMGTGLPGRTYDRMRDYVLSRVDLFLPVSNYTASLLKRWRLPHQRVEVVHNGTDPDHFRPTDGSDFRRRSGIGDRPLILFVGRLVGRKGVATIIDAMPRLLKSVPDAMFAVAGDGDIRPDLERRVSELGLGDHVVFTGPVSYDLLPEVYSASDVFAMPSRNEEPDVEGFGIVFLEANACGRPVIGARSGGIPDAIVDGKTGILVDADDTGGLASALEKLLTDRSLRERMGMNGRNRILRELTWDHVTERIVNELRKQVGNP